MAFKLREIKSVYEKEQTIISRNARITGVVELIHGLFLVGSVETSKLFIDKESMFQGSMYNA